MENSFLLSVLGDVLAGLIVAWLVHLMYLK